MLARCTRQMLINHIRCSACAIQSGSSSSSHMGVRLRPPPAAPQQPAQSRLLRSVAVVMGRRSAKIATRKGRSDQVKAKIYGKMGKLILQAARAGGPDPAANTRLKDLLQQARSSNVPRDIIDRNIKRATDKGQADFSEVLYEAYGPGGTGFIMAALTDNLNRTAAEVRTAVNKGGGKVADAGSVMFNFQRQGIIFLEPSVTEDEALEAAVDAGAEDVKPVLGDNNEITAYQVSTAVEDFVAVYRGLEAAGLSVREGSLAYVPLALPELDDETTEANEKMLDTLLGVDDIDEVWSNHAEA